MCGRFGLERPEFSETRFQAELLPDVKPEELLIPRYNIAPTQPVLTVAASKRLGGRRALKTMRWGLTPRWALADPSKPRSFNIRSEGIFGRPAFRKLLLEHRCAIVGDGFYEWRHIGGRSSQPYSIGLRGREPFAFAGIWVATKDANNEWLISCAILTGPPNPLVAELHDRQPIILPPEHEAPWLDSELTNPSELLPLLAPLPADMMDMFPVSNLVNNVANEGPELRRRVPEMAAPLAMLQ